MPGEYSGEGRNADPRLEGPSSIQSMLDTDAAALQATEDEARNNVVRYSAVGVSMRALDAYRAAIEARMRHAKSTDGLDGAGWPDRMAMLGELCDTFGVNPIGKPPKELWAECLRYAQYAETHNEAESARGAIQITAWHGTNVKTAAVIQREGFKPDCWFALDPRNALAYGGPVLLGVRFAVSGLPVDDDPPWQFHHPEPIPAERIVAVLAESARIEAESDLGAEVVRIVRAWSHGWSQCVSASEKALCTTTMHNLIDLVFDFDEKARAAAAQPPAAETGAAP